MLLVDDACPKIESTVTFANCCHGLQGAGDSHQGGIATQAGSVTFWIEAKQLLDKPKIHIVCCEIKVNQYCELATTLIHALNGQS
jgi:hypothetical protein